MPNLRVLSVARFWRCYVLLLIASMLSLFLIYLSQNDPSLKIYFQYFQPYAFSKDEMVKLMEPNKLDYEFLNIDPRACYRHQQANRIHSRLRLSTLNNDPASFNERDLLRKLSANEHDIEEDFKLLADNEEGDLDDEEPETPPRLKVLLLSIGKSVNYKSRLAARQTWYKFVNKQEVKLMFVVGNPAFFEKKQSASNLFRTFVGSDIKIAPKSAQEAKKSEAKRLEEQAEAARLDKEIRDYGDIIQVNMPDEEELSATKTILALRWALTYCEVAQNLFVLSESSVVNHHLFNDLVLNGLLARGPNSSTLALAKSGTNLLNDSSIVGVCDHSDEKFAIALREFIVELHKKKPLSQPDSRVPRSYEPLTSGGNASSRILYSARQSRDATQNSKPKMIQAIQNRSSTSASPPERQHRDPYKGQFCSNLGWLVTLNGAKKLWSAALRTSYMMNRSPAYLNGYLAFKADLRPVNLFEYHEEVPEKLNCHKLIEAEPKYLLCAENFTIDSRYTNYMASWNSVAQSQFNLAKL